MHIREIKYFSDKFSLTKNSRDLVFIIWSKVAFVLFFLLFLALLTCAVPTKAEARIQIDSTSGGTVASSPSLSFNRTCLKFRICIHSGNSTSSSWSKNTSSEWTRFRLFLGEPNQQSFASTASLHSFGE